MKDIKAAAKASHARKAHSVTHGGFKHGSTHAGHHAHGGAVHSDAAADVAQVKRMVRPSALKRADGGHIPGHKSHKPAGGGKAHTVINVHTGTPPPPVAPAIGALPPRPPMPPVGGLPPGAMPPAGLGGLGAAPGGPPPGMPPMRKEGGKVGHHMHAGAAGGEGRLEKAAWYGDRKRGGRS